MKLDKSKLYIKIIELNEIYNFIIDINSSLYYLVWKNIIFKFLEF
jgi:hypothetical protein